jgi:hypothetical protein
MYARRIVQFGRVFAGPYNGSSYVTPRNHPFHWNKRRMDSDLGLLWIPAGFILIFACVAVLFLAVIHP